MIKQFKMFPISSRILRSMHALTPCKSLCSLSASSNLAKVKISQGELQGKIVNSSAGKVFYSFQGIPYAKPPIGDLRFKPPEPANSWAGIRDASIEGNVCPHRDPLSGEFIGNEDCLFLNVYTPKLESEKPFPVMVWVHGGAYAMGSGNSDLYGANCLVEEGVILVTLNYRLGPLGFITLDIPEVPGNAGLRDQIEALRWVQRNISKFGGDPDNVTLFGESAGAACVHFLALSPMGKGLFKRIILQSGTALNEWSCNRLGKERSYMLGEFLGNKTKNPKELLDFLQKASVNDLVKSSLKVNTADEKRRGLPIPYCPTIEKEFPNVEICIPKYPIDVIQSGVFQKIPLIIGYNDSEGIAMINDAKRKLDAINTDFERMIPKFLDVEQGTENAKNIAKDIKRFYFDTKPVSQETMQQLVDLMTDYNFATGIHQMAYLYSKFEDNPIYVYRFSFVGILNIFKKIFGSDELFGACHGDEMFYLFKSAFLDPIEIDDTESKIVQKRMIKMWTNFAKTGDPTPCLDDCINVKWKPATKSSLNFLDIGKDLVASTNPDKKRVDFWMNLYSKCNGDFVKLKL